MIKKIKKESTYKDRGLDLITFPFRPLSIVKVVLMLTIPISFGASALGNSQSYFQATAYIEGASITAGEWTVDEGEEVSYGDVIINEIMWMGSEASSKDQWIELRNTTDRDIDIGKWTIENASNGGVVNIPANMTLPAGDFFLLAQFNDSNPQMSALNVTVHHNPNIAFKLSYIDNGEVILKDANSNAIDRTPEALSSRWPAGGYAKGTYNSMQRKLNSETSGTSTYSWSGCEINILSDSSLEIMKVYWKEVYRDSHCGTPGHPNLLQESSSSENIYGTKIKDKDPEDTGVDSEEKGKESKEIRSKPDEVERVGNNSEPTNVEDGASDSLEDENTEQDLEEDTDSKIVTKVEEDRERNVIQSLTTEEEINSEEVAEDTEMFDNSTNYDDILTDIDSEENDTKEEENTDTDDLGSR